MKNKTWSLIGGIAAVVLAATLIVGIMPTSPVDDPVGSSSVQSTESPGANFDPAFSTLSFPTSDAITTTFMAAAKNAAWTFDEDAYRWSYKEGSQARVALSPEFQLPMEEDLIFRFKSDIAPRLKGTGWETMNGSVGLDMFKTTQSGQYIYNFKHPDTDICTVEDLKNNLYIYTRSDIQANLQQKNLSNEHLNSLIDLLVCGGCFIESSIDKLMVWYDDYNYSSGGFYGNRICMRYSVSVPYDVNVSWTASDYDDYEYILYLFESNGSMKCSSTVGWATCSGDFVIPANTPFAIALRPRGLVEDIYDSSGEYRDDYGNVYTSNWIDMVSFELVK